MAAQVWPLQPLEGGCCNSGRSTPEKETRSSILLLFVALFTSSVSVFCGHGSSGRCPREDAANNSMVAVATSGGCGGRSGGQDCEGGSYVSMSVYRYDYVVIVLYVGMGSYDCLVVNLHPFCSCSVHRTS